MRILLCNDDGIDAPGLAALEARFAPFAEVWVVAPASEQSAKSHSLTMHKPLRALPQGTRRWAVTGTPADCIYVALHHLMRGAPPELVVSGVNRGSNLGSDVHYSGTVAAAREACLHGYPAIAVSLHRSDEDRPIEHWRTAAAVAERVVRASRQQPPARHVFLNVNVPDLAPEALRGLRAARLGDRFYHPQVDERVDPRGRSYLWIGGPHAHFGDLPDADGPMVEQGWATVTPLSAALTDGVELERLRAWTD